MIHEPYCYLNLIQVNLSFRNPFQSCPIFAIRTSLQLPSTCVIFFYRFEPVFSVFKLFWPVLRLLCLCVTKFLKIAWHSSFNWSLFSNYLIKRQNWITIKLRFSSSLPSLVRPKHTSNVQIWERRSRAIHTGTGRTWCCGGGEVLEFISGVMISRRAKLPMALFTIMGVGVGEEILLWYSAGSGFGNMACRDMCEHRGDSLGKGRVIWPSLLRKGQRILCTYWVGGPDGRIFGSRSISILSYDHCYDFYDNKIVANHISRRRMWS